MAIGRHPLWLAAGMIGLGAAAPGASAQDAPLVDAVGAYHHANVMTRPRHDDGAEPARQAPDSGQTPQGTLSRQQFDDLVTGLRAEYGRRVDRDGKASADAWLRRAVAGLKERYTHVAD